MLLEYSFIKQFYCEICDGLQVFWAVQFAVNFEEANKSLSSIQCNMNFEDTSGSFSSVQFTMKFQWARLVQELCESRGGRPGLSCPNEPSGFRGRKAILNHASALVSACP